MIRIIFARCLQLFRMVRIPMGILKRLNFNKMIEEVDIALNIFDQIPQLIGNNLLTFIISISLQKAIQFFRELSQNIYLGLVIDFSTTLLPFVIETVQQAQILPHLFIFSLDSHAFLV